MTFTLRLWTMTIVSFTAFTIWVFIHDILVPGLSTIASRGVVAGTAWIFGIAGTVVIIRFHRRAEKLAAKSARDETAIQLAGAVAHELNQPLTIIISTAELIGRRNPSRGDLTPYLQQIIDASERMADTVQKLDHLTGYQSKPYVGTVKIVDLDGASK